MIKRKVGRHLREELRRLEIGSRLQMAWRDTKPGGGGDWRKARDKMLLKEVEAQAKFRSKRISSVSERYARIGSKFG